MPAMPVPLTVLFWDAAAGPRAGLFTPGPPLLLFAAGEIEPAAVLAEELLADASSPGAGGRGTKYPWCSNWGPRHACRQF
jgi:hypothetical protein